jgi:hypothetical protein
VSAPAVKYETLVATYQRALVNVLRGHSAGKDYLELWVPDEDPVKSILNMIEAAQAAGRAALAIEVSADTLAPEQLCRLQELAGTYGEASVALATAGYIIELANLQKRRARTQQAELHVIEGGAATPAAIAKKRLLEAAAIDDATYDVIPVLTHALAAEDGHITHEGALSERAGFVLARGSSECGEIAVLAEPASHVIAAARHHGIAPGPRRTVAEIVCRAIEGRTVQDASDHGGIAAIHHLYEKAGRPKVPGILLPSNTGQAFADCVELLHRMRTCYAALAGLNSTANVFETPPSARWRDLPLAEKVAETDAAVRGFCNLRNLPADCIHVDRIEKDLLGHDSRVVITMKDSVPGPAKPILMRALERHLKKTIDAKIQLYLEPVKDANKIRRL